MTYRTILILTSLCITACATTMGNYEPPLWRTPLLHFEDEIDEGKFFLTAAMLAVLHDRAWWGARGGYCDDHVLVNALPKGRNLDQPVSYPLGRILRRIENNPPQGSIQIADKIDSPKIDEAFSQMRNLWFKTFRCGDYNPERAERGQQLLEKIFPRK